MIAVASLGTGNFNKIVRPPYVCANAPLELVNVSESGCCCSLRLCELRNYLQRHESIYSLLVEQLLSERIV